MFKGTHIILGARGFLGNQILLHKKSQNYKVRGYAKSSCSNNESGLIENLDLRVENLSGIQIQENDIVYDCIGLKTQFYGMNIEEFKLHKLKIFDYYEKLCQYIDKQNARKLVFISSSGALFNSNQNPGNVITEASIPLIVDGYGAATQIIEEILNSSQLFSKGKIVILRPTNVFGCNQAYKNNQGLIPRIFQALKYDEIISMNNDNSDKRDYLFIEDFLEAIDLVSDKIGTYIISSHESKSSFEVLESIGARLPFSDARTRISLKSRDEFIYSPLRVSSTKFRLETGWQPSWNFETAIEKITESYLEHM